MNKLQATYSLLIASAISVSANTLNFTSPNGKITAQLESDGFKIECQGSKVLNITQYGLGATTPMLDSVAAPKAIKIDYGMAKGKKSRSVNEANEYKLYFSNAEGEPFAMVLMMCNDGVAFKYEGAQAEERTTYRIPEGTERYMMMWTEPYEEFYPMSTTGATKNRHWGYPSLIKSETGNDAWALISEAGIERWHSASQLFNDVNATDYRVVPAANDNVYSGTWSTPWRVAIIGSLEDIIESTLIADLSPSPQPSNTDWIVPGSVSWVYWAYNHGSKDFQIVKQYIDMASQLHLPYILIDAEWDEMSNGGDINDAIAYAHSKGAKILIWYNSSTAWVNNGAPGPFFRLNNPDDREREFAWLKDMGVSGVKIDFFQGDTQPTMEYCIDLLESAARHNLLVNFHGATIPRGWQRTYPHLMTVEAVYGEEWYNNLPVLTNRAAAHNATLPFTRNIIGPMDYTPCAFSDSQHPHITSNAHELALPVLFESSLQHWADKPESYLAQPQEVHELMAALPTVWDETKLLGGYPADYAAIARRSGDDWYVAVINGTDNAREVALDWSKIGTGTWNATIFEDSESEPWKISRREITTNQLPATVQLMPRGGYVAHLKK